MAACTFFGHHDCPSSIKEKLYETIIDLIENHDVSMFYVGNHGSFDAIVRSVLRDLQSKCPQIQYAVVLAYLPGKKSEFSYDDYSDTMLPEGIEAVPRRFAITWRNKWMLRQAEYVVTYVTHSWGGAAQFAEMAEKKEVRNPIPELYNLGPTSNVLNEEYKALLRKELKISKAETERLYRGVKSCIINT